MTLAATGAGSGPYHVMSEPGREGFQHREKPVCGSDALTFAYVRADLVPLERRCADDGCFQAWPATEADGAFYRAAASPYGRRVAERFRT